MIKPAPCTNSVVDNHCKPANQRSKSDCNDTDDYAIMTMVEAGLGVSILAELMLRRTNFDIVCLPVEPPIYRTLAIGYKDKDSLPIASKYFIEYLQKTKIYYHKEIF